MTDELPEPLTPADCDLRDFQYMELDVVRLRDSKFAATPNAEAFRAGLLLWCASWHQVPAASMPDDDVELAKLAGYGQMKFSVREWRKVRQEALTGFIKCSDGRLYHSVVAEKANAAWLSRLEYLYDKLKERVRKQNKEREKDGLPFIIVPPFEAWLSAGRPSEIPPPAPKIPPENGLRRNGEGDGKGDGDGDFLSAPAPSAPPPPPPAPTPPPAPPAPKPTRAPRATAPVLDDDAAPTNAVWRAYASTYAEVHGVEPVRNREANALLKKLVEALGREEAAQVAAFYVRSTTIDPFYRRQKHPLTTLAKQYATVRTAWAREQIGLREPSREQLQETAGQRQAREAAEVLTGGRASARRPGDGPPPGHPASLPFIDEEPSHVAPRPAPRLLR